MVKKVLLIVVGAVSALLGAVLLIAGIVLLAFTGADGFITSDRNELTTPSVAFTSEAGTVGSGSDRALSANDVTIRVRARSLTGRPLFLGVGTNADVERYLSGSSYVVLTNIDFSPLSYDAETVTGGGTPAGPPGEQRFWLASTSGAGETTLEFAPKSADDLRVVIMDATADPGAGVSAEVSFGVKVGLFRSLAVGFLVASAVLVLVGLFLVIWGIRVRAGTGQPVESWSPDGGSPTAGWPGFEVRDEEASTHPPASEEPERLR